MVRLNRSMPSWREVCTRVPYIASIESPSGGVWVFKLLNFKQRSFLPSQLLELKSTGVCAEVSLQVCHWLGSTICNIDETACNSKVLLITFLPYNRNLYHITYCAKCSGFKSAYQRPLLDMGLSNCTPTLMWSTNCCSESGCCSCL